MCVCTVCVCVYVWLSGIPRVQGPGLRLSQCEYILWCVCRVAPFSYNAQQCHSQCWGRLAPHTVTYSEVHHGQCHTIHPPSSAPSV